MNPEDIDSGILSLVEGIVPPGIVRDAVAAQLQELQDNAVAEALDEQAAEAVELREKIVALQGALSNSAKKVAQLHAAHTKKVTLLHQTETAITKVLESKNPIVRWAAKRMRVKFQFDERQLNVQLAFEELAERDLQNERWSSGQHMPNGTGAHKYVLAEKEAQLATDTAFNNGTGTWLHILMEEVMEVAAETNPKHLKEELRQVRAVCSAWAVDLMTQTPKERPARERAPKVLRAVSKPKPNTDQLAELVDNRLVKE